MQELRVGHEPKAPRDSQGVWSFPPKKGLGPRANERTKGNHEMFALSCFVETRTKAAKTIFQLIKLTTLLSRKHTVRGFLLYSLPLLRGPATCQGVFVYPGYSAQPDHH